MTTLSRGANWYEDPSGRHEGRFWDGFTWTAHVFDAGVAGIDPPFAALTVAAVAPEVDANAGHGTRQLQAMATQAGITARAAAAANDTTADDSNGDRRTVLGMTIPSVVGLAALAIVAAVGISATGILQAGSGTPPAIATTAPASGDGFTADVPLGWAKAGAPAGSAFDAAYSVTGLESMAVGITDVAITEAQIADPATRTATIDPVAQMVAGTYGQVTRVVSHESRTLGARTVDVVTVEVTYPDGGTGQVVEYFVVGPNRAVVVAASGSAPIVAAHAKQLTGTARSIRFPAAG